MVSVEAGRVEDPVPSVSADTKQIAVALTGLPDGPAEHCAQWMRIESLGAWHRGHDVETRHTARGRGGSSPTPQPGGAASLSVPPRGVSACTDGDHPRTARRRMPSISA